MKVYADGKIEFALSDEVYCAKKLKDSTEITVNEDIAGCTLVVLTVPSAPLNLYTPNGGMDAIAHLTWNAPTNNGGSSIIGYRIERKDSGTWQVLVANTGNTNTTHQDFNYYAVPYRAAAINSVGIGPYSNEATFSFTMCFIGETNVTMSDGTHKKIVDVEIGDQILTYDGENIISDTVVYKYEIPNKDDYYLKITTEDKIINGVTKDHKIYTLSEEYLFMQLEPKEASKLKIGDVLLTEDNHLTKITNIEKIYKDVMVYNLIIKNIHKYFADGILVKNGYD